MNFRRICFLVCLYSAAAIGLMTGPVSDASARTAVSGSKTVTDFRPVGSTRMWTFTYYAKNMGRLFSTIAEPITVGERDGFVVKRRFHLDYELLRMEKTIGVEGESFVADSGYYLGDEITITNDSIAETLSMKWDDGALTGFFTRRGAEVDRSVPLGPEMFGWDVLLVDQLELFLAHRDLEVGHSIVDSVYMPQSMVMAPVRGTVTDFLHKEIYKNRFDSVFVVQFTQPEQVDAFFTSDKRLVRFDYVPQRIRAYLDLDHVAGQQESPSAASEVVSPNKPWDLVGAILLYLAVTVVSVFFYCRPSLSSHRTLVALIVGLSLGLALVPLELYVYGGQVSTEVAQRLVSADAGGIHWLTRLIMSLIHLTSILLAVRVFDASIRQMSVGGLITNTAVLGGALVLMRAVAVSGMGGGTLALQYTLAEVSLIIAMVSCAVLLAVYGRKGPGPLLLIWVGGVAWHLAVYKNSLVATILHTDEVILNLAAAFVTVILVLLTLPIIKRASTG